MTVRVLARFLEGPRWGQGDLNMIFDSRSAFIQEQIGRVVGQLLVANMYKLQGETRMFTGAKNITAVR